MNLAEAQAVAATLVESMRPFCKRIEIAGSIRRKKAQVKDIEIVVIPKWENNEPESLDTLFQVSKPAPVNLLYQWAARQKEVQWIKPGVSEIVPWQVNPAGKYWRGLTHFTDSLPTSGNVIKLDLFLCEEDNWGVIFAIRTGSADFSRELVTYARERTSYRVQHGRLTVSNPPDAKDEGCALWDVVACPEEKDLFTRLGLEYIEPERRVDGRNIIPLRIR